MSDDGGEEETVSEGPASSKDCGGDDSIVVEEGGKELTAGNSGGREVLRVGGAVLGPGSYWPCRISANACCRESAEAD